MQTSFSKSCYNNGQLGSFFVRNDLLANVLQIVRFMFLTVLHQRIQTRAKGESCMSDTTQTQMLQMTCETLKFYRSICEVILGIHLKVRAYQKKYLSHIQTSFTLMISLVSPS